MVIAPVFRFPIVRSKQLKDEGIVRWKEKGFTYNMRHNQLQQDFKIGYRFYEDGISYDVPHLVTKIEAATPIIQRDIDERFPINQDFNLVRCVTCPSDLIIIDNGTHSLKEEDQQTQVAHKTLTFLNMYLKEIKKR